MLRGFSGNRRFFTQSVHDEGAWLPVYHNYISVGQISKPKLCVNGWKRLAWKRFTLVIEFDHGSPWGESRIGSNGYNESFNGRLRDECLNVELFNNLLEAKTITEFWRKHYNTIRPHSSLRYMPPAPLTIQPTDLASAGWRLQPERPSNERNNMVT